MKKMKKMRSGGVAGSSAASKASSSVGSAARSAKTAAGSASRALRGPSSNPSRSKTISDPAGRPSSRYQGPSAGPSFKGGMLGGAFPNTAKMITSIGGSKSPAKGMNRPAMTKPTGKYGADLSKSFGRNWADNTYTGRAFSAGARALGVKGFAAGGIVGAPARSYKDMKAGAGSGVGRIQKTKIQRGR